MGAPHRGFQTNKQQFKKIKNNSFCKKGEISILNMKTVNWFRSSLGTGDCGTWRCGTGQYGTRHYGILFKLGLTSRHTSIFSIIKHKGYSMARTNHCSTAHSDHPTLSCSIFGTFILNNFFGIPSYVVLGTLRTYPSPCARLKITVQKNCVLWSNEKLWWYVLFYILNAFLWFENHGVS